MRVAIPTENGLICQHFGHSSQFAIIDINPQTKVIEQTQSLTPPPHDMGVLPAWLADMKCTHIIAGGMGTRALMLFEQNGILVISGAPQISPQEAVEKYINNELTAGGNPCLDPEFHQDHGDCSSHDH